MLTSTEMMLTEMICANYKNRDSNFRILGHNCLLFPKILGFFNITLIFNWGPSESELIFIFYWDHVSWTLYFSWTKNVKHVLYTWLIDNICQNKLTMRVRHVWCFWQKYNVCIRYACVRHVWRLWQKYNANIRCVYLLFEIFTSRSRFRNKISWNIQNWMGIHVIFERKVLILLIKK